MIKKITLFFLAVFICGCSNLPNQLAGKKDTFFSLDKNNSGKIISTYPDNQKIKSSGTLLNGKLEGKYIEYYESGQILLIAEYHSGKQNGISKEFYPNGNIKVEGYFVNNIPQGKFVYYYEDNNTHFIKNFKNGLYHGEYLEFYQNGNIKTKGTYINGYRNGTFYFYNENGIKIQEGNYINGVRSGIWTSFDENGKEISTINYDEPSMEYTKTIY